METSVIKSKIWHPNQAPLSLLCLIICRGLQFERHRLPAEACIYISDFGIASYPLWLLTYYITLPSVLKVSALCFPEFFPKLKLILKSTLRQVLLTLFGNWEQHLTLKMRDESFGDLITFSIEQFIRRLRKKVSKLVFAQLKIPLAKM